VEERLLMGGQLTTLGRDAQASPFLHPFDMVDDRHAEVRVGNNSGHLHFLDLYSQHGTAVYLQPEDAGSVETRPPMRDHYIISRDPFEIRLRSEIEQRWLRPE
jgi:hypothetical protein